MESYKTPYTMLCEGNDKQTIQQIQQKLSIVVKERDQLSGILNKKLEDYAKLMCSLPNQKITTSGGFCTNIFGGHKTDDLLINFLCKFLKGQSVVSFGEGLGFYKKSLTQKGCVKRYHAFDATPDILNLSSGRVKFMDLSVPQYGQPMYDTVLSLEVGEHIPIEYESTFLDNLTKFASKGVILSWAQPGQGGQSHVNERSSDYLVQKMRERGFRHIYRISKQMKDHASESFPWFRNGILYFERRNQTANGWDTTEASIRINDRFFN